MPLRRRAEPFAIRARMNEAAGFPNFEYCRDGVASAFPNCHDNFPLAVLVPRRTPITVMCFDMGSRY
jgi:hypothetical protein